MSQVDGSPLDTGKAAVACHCAGAVCDAGAGANNSSSPRSASGACNGGIPASARHCPFQRFSVMSGFLSVSVIAGVTQGL